jgi:hypothetical protein
MKERDVSFAAILIFSKPAFRSYLTKLEETGRLTPAAWLAHRRLETWRRCKRSQLLIAAHNETLPVVATCINNPDRSRPGNLSETLTGRVH